MSTNFTIEASDRKSLAEGFGSRGLDLTHFETRADRHKVNNGLEEELYILRRYLFSLESAGMLEYPVRISKSETPDFLGSIGLASIGLEVTEASAPQDQREMTLSEQTEGPHLLGTHGGRYLDGIRYDGNPRGRLPDRDMTADVLRAVRRKRKLRYPPVNIELLLYANGNAAVMSNLETALPLLDGRFVRWGNHLTAATRVNRVAIVKDNERRLLLWRRETGLKVLDLHESLD